MTIPNVKKVLDENIIEILYKNSNCYLSTRINYFNHEVLMNNISQYYQFLLSIKLTNDGIISLDLLLILISKSDSESESESESV